jgi:uncharacterized protein
VMNGHDRKEPGERTRVRRTPGRGRYDRESIYELLDDALVCHVGFVAEGLPYVIPMAVARNGDDLLLHGSSASRLVRILAGGADVCVSVTHVDGVVVSRSVFDNSMNYRSVVVFGRARPLVNAEEKLAALRVLVDHLIPGRWEEARGPNDQELKATTILSLPLSETSAKIRTGPPQDDHADLGLPVWAGEIPLRTVSLPPLADHLVDDLDIPDSVRRFRSERVAAIEDLLPP